MLLYLRTFFVWLKVNSNRESEASMPINSINRILQGLLLAGLCQASAVWASTPGAVSAQAPTSVGEVNLALGKAYIVHADGSREAVKTGLTVNVGDRIETQGNAHVHIRFVDDALVSVRPHSRLEIQRYDYRSDDPSASAVKFNLIEGVTRAISGEAAKSARQNFRMNTPVAAIGVRGTDFVVGADQNEARALVNEGAIVVAPFSATCLVDGLGPCSDNGLELVGGDQSVALVVADGAEPVLITANGGSATENFLAGAAVRADADEQPAEAKQPEEESGNDVYTESVSSRAVSKGLSSTKPRDPSPLPPGKPGYTPTAPLPEETLLANALVWGRYSDHNASREFLSLRDEVAREGRVTTVTLNNYVLYRMEDFENNVINRDLGVVDFDLKYAQAFYTSGGVESPVDVRSGELSIDFRTERFSTRLDMTQEQMGDVTFTSQGQWHTIPYNGYFNDRSNPTQSLSGAVSRDGREAAYAFQKQLENGLLEGLTLWGSNR